MRHVPRRGIDPRLAPAAIRPPAPTPADLRRLLHPDVLAHYRRYVVPGECVAIYVRGTAVRGLILGERRVYQAPPPNYGASAEWRQSQWTLAGVLSYPQLREELC